MGALTPLGQMAEISDVIGGIVCLERAMFGTLEIVDVDGAEG
jgi:hypothetical protein